VYFALKELHMHTILPDEGGLIAPHQLPELPYSGNALEPYISSRTLAFHHGKHHRGYVDATNLAVAGTTLAELPLADLVRACVHHPERAKLFNGAAQAWNHAFYWKSLCPGGGGRPAGTVLELIERSFESFDEFKKRLVDAAVGHFGSGWAWIVLDGDRLAIEATHDADTPIARGRVPLATIDAWEHASYLDHQNQRAAYVVSVIDRLLDWGFVAQNLDRAAGLPRLGVSGGGLGGETYQH
jgi:superoxide dismutase, Fe-Mn family